MKETKSELRKEIYVKFIKGGVHIIGLPCFKVPSLGETYYLDQSMENEINTTLYVGDTIMIGDDTWTFTTLTMTKTGDKVAYFNVHDENGKRIKSFFVNNNELYLLSLNQDTIDKYGVIEKINKKKSKSKSRYALKTGFVDGIGTVVYDGNDMHKYAPGYTGDINDLL